MTPKQAAEALAKARDLTRRAEHNRRTADKMPGTKSARASDARADEQSEAAEELFERIASHLEQADGMLATLKAAEPFIRSGDIDTRGGKIELARITTAFRAAIAKAEGG